MGCGFGEASDGSCCCLPVTNDRDRAAGRAAWQSRHAFNTTSTPAETPQRSARFLACVPDALASGVLLVAAAVHRSELGKLGVRVIQATPC